MVSGDGRGPNHNQVTWANETREVANECTGEGLATTSRGDEHPGRLPRGRIGRRAERPGPPTGTGRGRVVPRPRPDGGRVLRHATGGRHCRAHRGYVWGTAPGRAGAARAAGRAALWTFVLHDRRPLGRDDPRMGGRELRLHLPRRRVLRRRGGEGPGGLG